MAVNLSTGHRRSRRYRSHLADNLADILLRDRSVSNNEPLMQGIATLTIATKPTSIATLTTYLVVSCEAL